MDGVRDLDESDRLCGAATPPPWLFQMECVPGTAMAANRDFIAHARTTLPLRNTEARLGRELLAAVTALTECCHGDQDLDLNGECECVRRARLARQRYQEFLE